MEKLSYIKILRIVALCIGVIHFQEWIVIRPVERVYTLAFFIVLLSFLQKKRADDGQEHIIEVVIILLIVSIAVIALFFSKQTENAVLALSIFMSILIFYLKKPIDEIE